MEEDWSAGRKETDILEEKAARARALEGLQGVNALLKKFSEDEYLKDDLQQPQVMMALKHWTGEKRLPPEQATRLFAEDYRCRAVLEKLRVLQAECQKAGIPVPLDHVLRGEKELKLGGQAKATTGAKGENSGAKQEATTSDAKPSARRRTTSKGAAGAAVAKETVVADKPSNVISMIVSILMMFLGVLFAWYNSTSSAST